MKQQFVAKRASSVKQTLAKILRNPVKALFIGLIRFYQVAISPGIPSRCKYYPSCSHYALDAVREYGAVRGVVLAVWRVLRCNPFSYGGYDPVARQTLFRPRGFAEAMDPGGSTTSARASHTDLAGRSNAGGQHAGSGHPHPGHADANPLSRPATLGHSRHHLMRG